MDLVTDHDMISRSTNSLLATHSILEQMSTSVKVELVLKYYITYLSYLTAFRVQMRLLTEEGMPWFGQWSGNSANGDR